MSEHTPTPWQQGRLLSTAVTREWDKVYREHKQYEESALVCVNFHASDQGRGRRIVAVATDMDGNADANAAFICRAVNAFDALVAALTRIQGWLENQPLDQLSKHEMLRETRAALANLE